MSRYGRMASLRVGARALRRRGVRTVANGPRSVGGVIHGKKLSKVTRLHDLPILPLGHMGLRRTANDGKTHPNREKSEPSGAATKSPAEAAVGGVRCHICSARHPAVHRGPHCRWCDWDTRSCTRSLHRLRTGHLRRLESARLFAPDAALPPAALIGYHYALCPPSFPPSRVRRVLSRRFPPEGATTSISRMYSSSPVVGPQRRWPSCSRRATSSARSAAM